MKTIHEVHGTCWPISLSGQFSFLCITKYTELLYPPCWDITTGAWCNWCSFGPTLLQELVEAYETPASFAQPIYPAQLSTHLQTAALQARWHPDGPATQLRPFHAVDMTLIDWKGKLWKITNLFGKQLVLDSGIRFLFLPWAKNLDSCTHGWLLKLRMRQANLKKKLIFSSLYEAAQIFSSFERTT